MWDVSAAGHVSAGEDPRDTAVREAAEELGFEIHPDELRHIATQRERWVLNGGRYLDNEWQEVFLVEREVDIASLRPMHGELEEVTLVSLADFADRVAVRDTSLVGHWQEYRLILAVLGYRLEEDAP